MTVRLLTFALATGLAASAHCGILAVDFGLNGAPTQTGFVAFNRAANLGTNATQSQTYAAGVLSGSITVDVFLGAADGCGRDRGASVVSGPYSNLYRDLFTRLVEAASAAPTVATDTLRLSGLDPNTNYAIDIWSLDRSFNNGSQFSWWNVTSGTPALIGTITNNATAGTLAISEDTSFRVSGILQSNASGQIRLMHYDSIGTGTLNGLQITAVPEPTALIGLAAAPLLVLRRRHA